MRQAALSALTGVLLLALSHACRADDEMKVLADEAFFSVEVTGAPKPPGPPLPRFGKAFAIAPDIVVTSLETVGTRSDWQPKTDIPGVRMLDRQIALHGSGNRGTAETFVLPGLSEDVDAAAISAPELAVAHYFRLSLCPVDIEGAYSALVTSSSRPAAAETADDTTTLALVAKGFRPSQFGGLFVFQAGPNADFNPSQGHEGSPIFDRENAVVAIVSAVVVDGSGDTLVLATPIQPLLPGAQSALLEASLGDKRLARRLKCSLAQTVGELQADVSTLVTWDATATYDRVDGKLEDVMVTYSIAGGSSRLIAYEIEYQFWRKDTSAENPDSDWSRIPGDKAIGLLPYDADEKRTVTTGVIGDVGRKVVEKDLKNAPPGQQSIDLVKVFIRPDFGQGTVGTGQAPFVKYFPWRVAPSDGAASLLGDSQ